VHRNAAIPCAGFQRPRVNFFSVYYILLELKSGCEKFLHFPKNIGCFPSGFLTEIEI
jgi:hypothetical protein